MVDMTQQKQLPWLDVEAFDADPAIVLDGLRPHRIVRSIRGLEVISYDLGHALLGDPRLRPVQTEDQGASPPAREFVGDEMFLFAAPERRVRLRQLFMRAFAKKTQMSHDRVAATCHELAERLIDRSGGDLVEDYSLRLTSQLLWEMAGFPAEDIEFLVGATLELSKFMHGAGPQHVLAAQGMFHRLLDYAVDLLAERRRRPTGDFLSALAVEDRVNDEIATDEVAWGIMKLLLNNINTSNFQFASVLWHLAEPERWERAFTDPYVRDAAIQEAIRLSPAETIQRRIADTSFEIDDVTIPAGVELWINLVATSRDPAKYEDPHKYRLDRAAHLSAAGRGFCPRSGVGRTRASHEIRTGLEIATLRLTDVQVARALDMHGGAESIYGLHTLPVTFKARLAH
jgi:cytochrome P450